ncbi:hypothetical protein KFE25_000727 [Diacronema lutheri]|uniref:Uncharacterized protein n=1 Tax=Diacronema lutheri TaxID=2081491 RepID=A0A8J5XEP5_DIALT|nr:hypothetical protein KFE25_000727 [Diacronema lutheri]
MPEAVAHMYKRAVHELQGFESRVWEHTNSWIDQEHSRDGDESAQSWRSWAWERASGVSLSGAISRVRGAIKRDEPYLPR